MKPIASGTVTLERHRDDLRRSLERAAARPDASGPASQRAPQYPERVRDETLRWLASLPEHVRPVELTRRYPRIANKIAMIWRRVARCEEYLDELVVDKRGGRRGFSMAVAQELAVLRRHYAALHPAGNGVWEMEGKGR